MARSPRTAPAYIGMLLAGAALAGCARTAPPAPVDNRAHERFGRPPATGAATNATATAHETTPGIAIVQGGDTLFGLARRHKMPIRAVIDANNLEPPYVIHPGQRLVLPKVRTHTVQSGDTIFGLSRRYGVEMNALVRANAVEPPYAIQVGQTLILPGPIAGSLEIARSRIRESVNVPSMPAAASALQPVPETTRVVESAALPPPTMPAAPPAPPEPPAISAPARPDPLAQVTAPGAAPVDEKRTETARRDEPGPKQSTESPKPAAESETTRMAEAVDVPPRGGRVFLWPLRGRLLSDYGPKTGGLHNDGINIAAPLGASVRAAENGVVVYAGNELRGFGNLLLLRHADGWMTAYAHIGDLMVSRGDRVRRGQVIARVGQTGNVTSPQLHFEIRRGTKSVNPREYLSAQSASSN